VRKPHKLKLLLIMVKAVVITGHQLPLVVTVGIHIINHFTIILPVCMLKHSKASVQNYSLQIGVMLKIRVQKIKKIVQYLTTSVAVQLLYL
jgi:hypothetical protein